MHTQDDYIQEMVHLTTEDIYDIVKFMLDDEKSLTDIMEVLPDDIDINYVKDIIKQFN